MNELRKLTKHISKRDTGGSSEESGEAVMDTDAVGEGSACKQSQQFTQSNALVTNKQQAGYSVASDAGSSPKASTSVA